MSIKDAVGNELHEGDFVIVKIDKLVRFKIDKLVEPGTLSVPNAAKQDQMGFVSMLWLATDPIAKGAEFLPHVYKSPSPEAQALVEKVSDSVGKSHPATPLPFIKH